MRAFFFAEFTLFKNAQYNFAQMSVTEYSTNQVIDTLNANRH
jgi:hypothetical protein